MYLTIEAEFTNAFREIVRNTIRSMPLIFKYCGIAAKVTEDSKPLKTAINVKKNIILLIDMWPSKKLVTPPTPFL